jgi:hypothetical protein
MTSIELLTSEDFDVFLGLAGVSASGRWWAKPGNHGGIGCPASAAMTLIYMD